MTERWLLAFFFQLRQCSFSHSEYNRMKSNQKLDFKMLISGVLILLPFAVHFMSHDDPFYIAKPVGVSKKNPT